MIVTKANARWHITAADIQGLKPVALWQRTAAVARKDSKNPTHETHLMAGGSLSILDSMCEQRLLK